MNKAAIKDLQYKLRKVLNISLSVDGDYGPSTTKAVQRFQSLSDLFMDGIAGPKTLKALGLAYLKMFKVNSNLLHFFKTRLVVFVDAGHGGIDDNGRYVTPGKRAYHQDLILHERGHYYEGFENRLAAEAFIEACTKKGIQCIRTYHPHKDWSLGERTEIVRSYLRRGYCGYLHSFHSNAISRSNSAAKLRDTVGFMVYSTRETNFSDQIAAQHFKHVKEIVGADNWNYRTDKKDGDVDFEANFQILRETDLQEFDWFGSFLEEWGFHTSSKDVQFITNNDNRFKRVEAALKTALWVRDQFNIPKA